MKDSLKAGLGGAAQTTDANSMRGLARTAQGSVLKTMVQAPPTLQINACTSVWLAQPLTLQVVNAVDAQRQEAVDEAFSCAGALGRWRYICTTCA